MMIREFVPTADKSLLHVTQFGDHGMRAAGDVAGRVSLRIVVNGRRHVLDKLHLCDPVKLCFIGFEVDFYIAPRAVSRGAGDPKIRKHGRLQKQIKMGERIEGADDFLIRMGLKNP